MFRPHVTFRARGRRDRRVDFAEFPLEDFVGALQALQLDFARLWWKRQTRVTGEQLSDEGWVLIGADQSLLHRLAPHFCIRRNGLRLCSPLPALLRDLERIFFEDQYDLAPILLDEETELVRKLDCVLGVRVDDDGAAEACWIHYVSFETFIGGPGWYATPLDTEGAKMMVELLLMKYREPLLSAVRTLEATLGLPLGSDRFDE